MEKRPFIGRQFIYGREGEHDTIYLRRYFIGRLALHIFNRGDADPDCHDHPWDFWTFPLTPYVEEYIDRRLVGAVESSNTKEQICPPSRKIKKLRVVRAFRINFRPAEHTHRVIGRWSGYHIRPTQGTVWGYPRADEIDVPTILPDYKMVTIVWFGRRRRDWGFLVNKSHHWMWVAWRRYVYGEK